jgi:thioredoxin-like negative regulator of GroEL
VAQPPGTHGQSDPELVEALKLLERLRGAIQRGDRAAQNQAIEALVELRAPMGEQWQALASFALRNGEVALARKAIDLFVEAHDGAPAANYQKAALLEQAGALREAYELMCALPADTPDPASNAYSRGTAALFLGDTEEARAQLERATTLRPDLGAAWLSLATCVDLAQEPALAERIFAAQPAAERAAPAERAAYFYAAGKAHADLGAHKQAFTAFARGAQTMKALTPYDPVIDRRHAEESLHGYSAEGIAAIARRQTASTAGSIFVTGSPRSGTTLVQQILTGHSAVSGGGELARLPLLAGELGGHSFPAVQAWIQARGAAPAALLWRHWLSELFPAPGRVVDKSIDTTRFIGLAAALLPDAPLIWLTRDPLDCAWSCFRTFFIAAMPWSYDQAEIAFHLRIEAALRERWQDILGDRLLVVPYEALVADPAQWTRRILSHCELSEEPQAFAPHEGARTVTTASVMQVRRPVNRRSVGSAEPYRAVLQPFIEAYGEGDSGGS